MLTRAITVFLTLTTAAAAVLITVAVPASAAGSPGGGGCGASGYMWGYWIACQGGTASPGTPAASAARRGGGTTAVSYNPCALYPVAGDPTHMLQVCPLPSPYGGTHYGAPYPAASTLIPAAQRAPAVTLQELVARARNELGLPLPVVRTAPPRGSDGLVGLPEWFWVSPAQWRPRSRRVQAGGVWAQVTAQPSSIRIWPGTGAAGSGVTCHGPGAPYDAGLPASAQRSSCAYTYTQSSDGLPGSAYEVSVTVTWTASWEGSGGAGGGLPALGRTTTFALPVAEAQALTPGS